MAPPGPSRHLPLQCCSDVPFSAGCRIASDRDTVGRGLYVPWHGPDRHRRQSHQCAGHTCCVGGGIRLCVSMAGARIGGGRSSASFGARRSIGRAHFYDLFVAGSSALAGAAAERWGLTAPFCIALACFGGAAALVLITGIGTTSLPRSKTCTQPAERQSIVREACGAARSCRRRV